MFKRTDYHYDLPESLIAAEPLAERDQSRLLVLSPDGHIHHKHIYDLPELLKPGTLIVANNTRVFAARLRGERPRVGAQGGGRIEFFMLKQIEPGVWEGLMKSSARIDPGFEFVVLPSGGGEPVAATVLGRRETNAGTIFTARFALDPVEHHLGETPLPPYIASARVGTRSRLLEKSHTDRQELDVYNTTFARETGSVAAPTAGRHFTPELIARLRERGVEWAELTLHVGLGTFKPVAVDDIREHLMHAESATVSSATASAVNRARASGRSVLAVGTTSVRTLEGFWNEGTKQLDSGTRAINLFIHPGSGHQWNVVDQLLTNFHLPESTLLMMICDFMGNTSSVMRAYQEAIAQKYRFYSYGDAMLISGRAQTSGSTS